ncbi:MAG: hypothetical protein J3Q66DRAFT_352553 [Benniella sp.]|nr:MAG: hypothetical protein J3Q66DRAFT_352553 [Benniella sp.]
MVLVASSTHLRLLLSPSASLFRIAGPEQSLLEARPAAEFRIVHARQDHASAVPLTCARRALSFKVVKDTYTHTDT